MYRKTCGGPDLVGASWVHLLLSRVFGKYHKLRAMVQNGYKMGQLQALYLRKFQSMYLHPDLVVKITFERFIFRINLMSPQYSVAVGSSTYLFFI